MRFPCSVGLWPQPAGLAFTKTPGISAFLESCQEALACHLPGDRDAKDLEDRGGHIHEGSPGSQVDLDRPFGRDQEERYGTVAVARVNRSVRVQPLLHGSVVRRDQRHVSLLFCLFHHNTRVGIDNLDRPPHSFVVLHVAHHVHVGKVAENERVGIFAKLRHEGRCHLVNAHFG